MSRGGRSRTMIELLAQRFVTGEVEGATYDVLA
jgi:hypothetical protein